MERESSMMCPKGAMHGDFELRLNMMIVSESPSNITSWRPISRAKDIALLHARASTSSTVSGSTSLSIKEPIISPEQSLITTPIPAGFSRVVAVLRARPAEAISSAAYTQGNAIDSPCFMWQKLLLDPVMGEAEFIQDIVDEMMEKLNSKSSSSFAIVHHGFDNSTSSCDDYSDIEPEESDLFSYDAH
nr:hypothetical protein CFP56_19806 [Quercus suber]